MWPIGFWDILISIHCNDLCQFFGIQGKNPNLAKVELLVAWLNSLGRPLSPPPSDVTLMVAVSISAIFRNSQSNIHTHFTSWLVSCVEVRMEPGFELFSLFFHSWNNYLWHFLCVQPSATLWISSRRLQKSLKMHVWSDSTSSVSWPLHTLVQNNMS